jgi:enterochelin esterase-like enzyme
MANLGRCRSCQFHQQRSLSTVSMHTCNPLQLSSLMHHNCFLLQHTHTHNSDVWLVVCVVVVCLFLSGHNKDEARHHPYPVLYCNDGQNMFGDCATLSGNSWRVAHTAAELIQSGKLPPFMVVGLDHAGPLRSLEYTPYTPGTGPGAFRCEQQGRARLPHSSRLPALGRSRHTLS